MATIRYEWQGGNNGGSLTDGADWSPSGVPGAGDIIVFGDPNQPQADDAATGSTTVGQLIVHKDDATLSGGTVSIQGLPNANYSGPVGIGIDNGGTLTLDGSSAAVSVSTDTVYIGTLSTGALDMTGSSTLTDTAAIIGGNGSTATLSGAGAKWTTGTLTIDKGGSLDLEGGGTASITGTLTVDAGATIEDIYASKLSAGGGILLSGTLTFDGLTTIGSTITLDGGEIGAVNALKVGTATLGAPIILTAGSTPDIINGDIDDNGTELTVTGAISDGTAAAPLEIKGFVRLSHAGNTYSAGTVLESGANLRVAAAGAAGTGAIGFAADDAILAVSPGVTLANTIEGFQAGDQIVLAGVTATSASWANGVLTLQNAGNTVATLDIAGDFTTNSFTVTEDGKGEAIVTGAPATTVFTLTTGSDTVAGSSANDTVIAAGGTLTAGDAIDGGGGTNSLVLQGGGVFHLNAPQTLANIQIVQTSEGGSAADQQNLYLRSGTDLTVQVSGSADNPSQPWLNAITIHGADNTDTIRLGPGYDTVILGGAGETVIGGSGPALVSADTGMLGATLTAGSGGGTLLVTGSGAGTMGAGITGFHTVSLAATVGSLTANAQSNLTVEAGTTGQTLAAGGANQTLVGTTASAASGPHQIGGFETLIGSSAGSDTFKGTLASFNGDTIQNFTAGDALDVTGIAPANLSFSPVDTPTLTETDGAGDTVAVAQFSLPGSFDPSGFAIAGDGHGGSLITYSAPVASSALKLSSAMAGFGAGGSALETSAGSSTAHEPTPLLAASPTSHS